MEMSLPQEILVERKYYLNDEPTAEIVIAVARPIKEDNGCYRCFYEIRGAGQDRIHSIAGIDELDALRNALEMIGGWMNGVNATEYEGRLRWVGGGEDGNLGLPTIEGRGRWS
jgi:hypothetical protein